LQNATLLYSTNSNMRKRDLNFGFGGSSGLVNSTKGGPSHVVYGIEAFSESLLIPSAKCLLFESILTVVHS